MALTRKDRERGRRERLLRSSLAEVEEEGGSSSSAAATSAATTPAVGGDEGLRASLARCLLVRSEDEALLLGGDTKLRLLWTPTGGSDFEGAAGGARSTIAANGNAA